MIPTDSEKYEISMRGVHLELLQERLVRLVGCLYVFESRKGHYFYLG